MSGSLSKQWLDESRFNLADIRITVPGAVLRGSGCLRWHPDRGFELDGQLSRHGVPLPPQRSYGGGVSGIEAERVIRGRTDGGLRLVVFGYPAIGNLPLLEHGDLHVRGARMHLLSPINKRFAPQHPTGRALLLGSSGGRLLDEETLEHRIRGELIARTSRRAFEHDGGGLHLRILDDSSGYIDASWLLRGQVWHRRNAWNAALAVRYTLTLLLGRTFHVALREVERARWRVTEFSRREEAGYSSNLLPLGSLDAVTRKRVLSLFEFFAHDSHESRTCQLLLDQLEVAGSARTRQQADLLASSALEAALRTLYRVPFGKKKSKFLPRPYLERFQREYLDDTWCPNLEAAALAYFTLRDRAAHPDWITEDRGRLSGEELRGRRDSIYALGVFYSAFILALANTDQIDPGAVLSPRTGTLIHVSQTKSNRQAGGGSAGEDPDGERPK